MRRLFVTLLACAPAALVAQTDPGSYPTIEHAPPPNYGAVPPARDERPRSQLGWYAQTYGVSDEEAQRRTRMQREISEEVGRLRQRLETDERGNYADLWMEHTPEWGMFVGFKRDAEATLRRYTSHPLFTARQVRFSLAELEAAQADAFAQLRRLGIPAEGGTYVQHNEVRITAAVDQSEVDELVRSGRLRVAPPVRLTGRDALVPAEPVAPEARRFVRILPQARYRTGMETSELNLGTIVLRDGCFRLDGAGEDDPLAYFGAETGVRLDGQGALTLYQRGGGGYDSEPARVGERMVLGGGAGREIADSDVVSAVRAACGPGRIVYVGNPRSYAAFRVRHSAWRVAQVAEARRISRDEAWRGLTACWARRIRAGTRSAAAVRSRPTSCRRPARPCRRRPRRRRRRASFVADAAQRRREGRQRRPAASTRGPSDSSSG